MNMPIGQNVEKWDLDWQEVTLRVVEDNGFRIILGIDKNKVAYPLSIEMKEYS